MGPMSIHYAWTVAHMSLRSEKPHFLIPATRFPRVLGAGMSYLEGQEGSLNPEPKTPNPKP